MNGSHKKQWWQLALAVLAVPLLLFAFAEGPPSEHTAGFGEPNCTECHVGSPVNSGAGSITITVRDGANIVSEYASGQTYQITVRVADPQRTSASTSRWGFELSARTQGGQQAGNLAPSSNRTQILPTFNGIQYISHTPTGTSAGTTLGANFVFNWTAPDISAGPVLFHAAGNSANNSQTELGDRIYTTSVTIQPEQAGPTPDVFSGGILNNASYELDPAPKAAGSIVAIFGANLNNGSSNPNPLLDSNNKVLTTLGGASVTFNGFAAPMFYSFPGQLGAQIPYEVAGQTTASVVVTVAGQSSVPRTIFIDTAAPGLFTLNQQGSGQGAILIGGVSTAILAAPVVNNFGIASRPARRGEVITIFCTGLGVVNPPAATGVLAGVGETSPRAIVTIDGLPAVVQYSGTAPGFVGLNQINAVVPNGARFANDVTITVSQNNKLSNTATIAVGP